MPSLLLNFNCLSHLTVPAVNYSQAVDRILSALSRSIASNQHAPQVRLASSIARASHLELFVRPAKRQQKLILKWERVKTQARSELARPRLRTRLETAAAEDDRFGLEIMAESPFSSTNGPNALNPALTGPSSVGGRFLAALSRCGRQTTGDGRITGWQTSLIHQIDVAAAFELF